MNELGSTVIILAFAGIFVGCIAYLAYGTLCHLAISWDDWRKKKS